MFLMADDTLYREPPKPVRDALIAPPTPTVSVSPLNDYAIFLQQVRYPSIADVAQPMLRLAGIRIDTNTSGMHLARNYVSFTITRLSDGAAIKVPLLRPERRRATPSGVRTANSSPLRTPRRRRSSCGSAPRLPGKYGAWMVSP